MPLPVPQAINMPGPGPDVFNQPAAPAVVVAATPPLPLTPLVSLARTPANF